MRKSIKMLKARNLEYFHATTALILRITKVGAERAPTDNVCVSVSTHVVFIKWNQRGAPDLRQDMSQIQRSSFIRVQPHISTLSNLAPGPDDVVWKPRVMGA